MFKEEDNLEKAEATSEIDVIDYNLRMLNAELLNLLMEESVGGYAGGYKIDEKNYSCGAANSFADPETGEIKAFGNPQDVAEDVKKDNVIITLRVAFSLTRGFFKIVEFIGKETISISGQNTINVAIEKWNKAREVTK